MKAHPGCELCERAESPAWAVVATSPQVRVIRVLDAPEFPAFYRVVWREHVAELSGLLSVDRVACLVAGVVGEAAHQGGSIRPIGERKEIGLDRRVATLQHFFG